jgi:DNA replicative helicase MCM subunit Mcm2 (Cdc46/Mcm family)
LLSEKDHPRRAIQCALRSVGIYGNVELDPIKLGVKDALDLVIEGGGESIGDIPTLAPSEGAVKVEEKVSDDSKDTVLEIIKELTGDKGALYRDIITECEKKGIDKIQLEETIQELLDEGQVYEPTIGIIKPV